MATVVEPPARDGLAFRGKHWRLWVGNDSVVRFVVEGDQDKRAVEDILEALGAIGDQVPERPIRVLYYAHRTVRLAPDARERLVEACRAHLNLRLAVVRPSPLALIQARAIARHSAHTFTYHDNERDALLALGLAEARPAKPAAPVAEKPAPVMLDLGVVDHVS